MILPVIGTIGTRVLIAALNLGTVAVSARWLGLEAVGSIALLVLGITFILLINNVVGGSGLVYLTPRHGTNALRWPAYGWAMITAVVAWVVLREFPLVPEGLELHAVGLALLQSVAGIHLGMLLGRERYGAANTLHLLQAVVLFSTFIFLLRRDGASLHDYVVAAYFAHGSTAVISGWFTLERPSRPTGAGHPILDLFRQGTLSQLANGLQLLNYRAAYYLVDRFQGTSALGLFSITTQLAESAWLAPKSLGTVLYARVSNTADRERQRDITLAVLKVAVGLAILATILFLVLPESIYRFVFGPSIHSIAPLVAWMAPGLIAMSASQAFSHYLSGSGRVHHNTIGSGLGLIVTLLVGYQAIPAMGLSGAAITTSAAYTASVIYQLFVFNRISGARMRNYLPEAGDFDRLATVWRRWLGR